MCIRNKVERVYGELTRNAGYVSVVNGLFYRIISTHAYFVFYVLKLKR